MHKKRHYVLYFSLIIAFLVKLAMLSTSIHSLYAAADSDIIIEMEATKGEENTKENIDWKQTDIYQLLERRIHLNISTALAIKSNHFEQSLNYLNPFIPIFSPPPNA